MKVLLDVGISPRLGRELQEALGGAAVESAIARNWRTLRNGELLHVAEQTGFTVLVTADKSLAAEQAPLALAVVAVDDNRLGPLRNAIRDIARAIRDTPAGEQCLVSTGSD